MKNIYKNIRCVLGLLFAITITSCKKDGYLKDGGLHSTSSSLSTYDYLKSNRQFDTTVLLIDHFNLKDSVNKASTVFAFTDDAINKFMQDFGYTSLTDMYDSVSSGLLTQYMFNESITLDNATTNAVEHTNWAGGAAPSAITKIINTEYVYLTSSAPAFNYYSLVFVKINGVSDDSPNRPSDDLDDVNIICQTTGIKTSTGATMHILVNNAPLNKL